MPYGQAAVDTVKDFVATTNIKDPVAELINLWNNNSVKLSKGDDCPKYTFLGLCSAGYIFGIPACCYTNSIKNRLYGETALKLLKTFSCANRHIPR